MMEQLLVRSNIISLITFLYCNLVIERSRPLYRKEELPPPASKQPKSGLYRVTLPIYGISMPKAIGSRKQVNMYTPFTAQPGEAWWPILV